MSLPDVLAEDRRFIILTTLDEAPGFSANENVLTTTLDHIGHRVGRDVVRADLAWLQDHGLVSIEAIGVGSGFWIVTLREEGQSVAQGRLHPGIARPRPK